MISKTSLIFVLCFFSLIKTSNAQDAKDFRISVGAGVSIKKNLRVNNQYENMRKKTLIRPIPMVIGNIGRFSLGPQGLSFMAIGNRGMSASIFINRTGDRYQGIGMAPRKDSAFTGLALRFINYGLNISHDLHGRSKGSAIDFSYGEFKKISEELVLRVGLGLDWRDDRYAEYYFGVRKSEATPTRNEYHLTNYLQPGVNLSPIYKFSETISVFGALSLKFVPKKIRQSPTMNGDKFEISSLLGSTYTF